MIKKIFCKLGPMKKVADWVVYPDRGGGADNTEILIQSDHRICQFDPVTRQGVLSVARPNGAFFLHLSPLLGAIAVEVPQDVVDACLAAKPKSGDVIGNLGGGVVRIA